jgi:hypothetical protein
MQHVPIDTLDCPKYHGPALNIPTYQTQICFFPRGRTSWMGYLLNVPLAQEVGHLPVATV